jgi:hypothetical protein
LKASAPPPALGHTTIIWPGRRCGATAAAKGSVLYAGPTAKTRSAPSRA